MEQAIQSCDKFSECISLFNLISSLKLFPKSIDLKCVGIKFIINTDRVLPGWEAKWSSKLPGNPLFAGPTPIAIIRNVVTID